VSGVDGKLKDRYREPSDPQARLVRGFAVDRCGGKIDFRDDSAGHAMVVTPKAKMQRRQRFLRTFRSRLDFRLPWPTLWPLDHASQPGDHRPYP